MNKDSFSDVEILELFNDAETREMAFRIIVKQFGRQLYNRIRMIVGTHEETDDILQNTFVKAWRALSNFRLDASLYTWLFRIATNESLTYLRKSNRNLSVSLDDEESNFEPGSEEMETSETGDEIAEKLRQAVEKLPAKQRLVFTMKYYKEMKYEDMAVLLNTSVGALKASYHHAVKKIEILLST
ncbi:MAG: sigma-70 family RNA polymerase sigma factor [Bacteroidales bacterium]|jgi:RNA polymerase sigma-70 factor (ECF subfamily)|nr:sigma-70 family RNA polymerase sigma factor [Bacteroidales bacterium]